MNIDLVIKLARLANNNPNENEANLAARKVCRLLAEGEFKFTITAAQPKANTVPPGNRPEDGRTWNDVKRSSEPFWRPPNTSWFDDFYTNQRPKPTRKVRCTVCRKEYKIEADPHYFMCATCIERAEEVKKEQSKGSEWAYIYWEDQDLYYRVIRDILNGLKKDMTCTKCKAVFNTAFVGLPETYICFGCQRKE